MRGRVDGLAAVLEHDDAVRMLNGMVDVVQGQDRRRMARPHDLEQGGALDAVERRDGWLRIASREVLGFDVELET